MQFRPVFYKEHSSRSFPLQLILLFSVAYVKYFISKRDGTISTTVSSVVALSVTLLTTALIPVDVFLVSFMKNTDGTFKVSRY